MSAFPVSVMIFTLNEEINLPACLDSLTWCDDLIVVDSFSSDRTVDMVRSRGARFFQHPFDGFGNQRNWALNNTAPKYDWVLILDADERVTPELADELADIARRDSPGPGAYRVRRRFFLWGRWLRYSSLYPTWVVRFVRRDRIRYVNRGHAETQVVEGDVGDLAHDLIDENLKGIDEWYERQNRYSRKDADHEIVEEKKSLRLADLGSADPLRRRAALKRLASRLPCRPTLYFLYSYILRGGFRDGKDGFVFCRMKADYQRMIAAKKYDSRRRGTVS